MRKLIEKWMAPRTIKWQERIARLKALRTPAPSVYSYAGSYYCRPGRIDMAGPYMWVEFEGNGRHPLDPAYDPPIVWRESPQ